MLNAPIELAPTENVEPIEMFGKTLTPIKLLGEGQWGAAWLVSDDNGALFTLKSTDTEHGNKEAVINRKLGRLMGYEINPDDDTACALLLQYVEGQSLKELLDTCIEQVLQDDFGQITVFFKEDYLESPVDHYQSGLIRNIMLAIEVTKAMAYLHKLGISHGDVDFGNYIVSNNDKITAVDFGLSKDVSLMKNRNNVAFAIGGDIDDLRTLLAKMLPYSVMQALDDLYGDDRLPPLTAVIYTLHNQLTLNSQIAAPAIVNAFTNMRSAELTDKTEPTTRLDDYSPEKRTL